MPRLSPISWGNFVRRMKVLAFSGPYQEGKHPYMLKGNLTITIPNPHSEDISPDLLSRVLKQANITRNSWLKSK